MAANIHARRCRAENDPARTPSAGDMFDAYVAYLRHSATHVEKVYQLGERRRISWVPALAESREFTAARLAAGRQHASRHDLYRMA